MLTINRLLMIASSALLLVVDWLAFHDFAEPHTVRDWLMLVATVLVLAVFVREFGESTEHRA